MFGKTRIGAAILGGLVFSGVVAVALTGTSGTAGAAGRTITVTFGDSGPTPGAVKLSAGDRITYVNKVTQAGTLALPLVTAQVQSAAVSVHGAATSDIPLPQFDSSVTVTYPSAGTIKYTATYTYRLLPLLNALGINLVPATATHTYSGTLGIAAAPQQQPAKPGSGGGAGAGSGGGSAGSGGGAQAPAGQVPAGQVPVGNAPPVQGGTGYQPQGPSVADRTVPHGTGSGTSTGAGNGATNARAQSPLGAPPANLPQLPSDGTEAVLTGSAPNAGLGLPAILAIVLLSVVTAALVRALVTQRRTVAV
jgi:hypothetical protein